MASSTGTFPTILGLTNVGSNYAWTGNDLALLTVSASRARAGYEVLPDYIANAVTVDSQLAAMRAAGQTSLSIPIFFTTELGDSSPSFLDAHSGQLSSQAISEITAFLSEVKRLGFTSVEYRAFPIGAADPTRWNSFDRLDFGKYLNVIDQIHSIGEQAGLPYRIDLLNEGMPVSGYAPQAPLLEFDKLLWSHYVMEYGTANTVGFSTIADPNRVASIPTVYGSVLPAVFDFHIYGPDAQSPPGAPSTTALFDQVYSSLNVLGISGRPWIIGETYYDDTSVASELAVASTRDDQVVQSLYEWPVDFANIRSADGDGGTDVAPPIQIAAYTAVLDQSGSTDLVPPPSASQEGVIGAGPDEIELKLSEDYFDGDAEFTITVDGEQIGGIRSVHALHDLAQDEVLDVRGDFPGPTHTINLYFLNHLDGLTPGSGRNFYVDAVSLNGVPSTWGEVTFSTDGGQQILTGLVPQSSGVIGYGTHDLRLLISEDEFKGDALFNVFIDGAQVGGTQMLSSSHALGQDRTLDVYANLSAGDHTFALQFLNDANEVGPNSDRNLYLDGAVIDDLPLANSHNEVYGLQTFEFEVAEVPTVNLSSISGAITMSRTVQSPVSVTLSDNAGRVVETTKSNDAGGFSLVDLVPGDYLLSYVAPQGEQFETVNDDKLSVDITIAVTVDAGTVANVATQHLVPFPEALVLSGRAANIVRGPGTYTVTGTTGNGKVVLGDGDQRVQLGGFYNSVTLGRGNQVVNLDGPGDVLRIGDGSQSVILTGNFDSLHLGNTPIGGVTSVVAIGSGEVIDGGTGNISIQGPTGNAKITLGTGSHSIALAGSHNSVSVGKGTATIDAGTNGAIVHASGGDVTVKVEGQSNLIDIGPGLAFIDAGLSRLDTFMLNASGEGMTTISGFRVGTGDVLDLDRTLQGTQANQDLSNVGSFISAVHVAGDTILQVSPNAESDQVYAFATLQGVITTVATLTSYHTFRL